MPTIIPSSDQATDGCELEYHTFGLHPGDKPDRGIKTKFLYKTGHEVEDNAGVASVVLTSLIKCVLSQSRKLRPTGSAHPL